MYLVYGVQAIWVVRLEFLTVCPHISSMSNPILRARVVNSVRFAGFNNVQHYANSVCRAIKEFKEYENPRYYNYKKPNKQERSYVPTLKKIKRPTKIQRQIQPRIGLSAALTMRPKPSIQ